MSIIEQIFRGKELTLCGHSAILNKWSRDRLPVEVSTNVAFNLINRSILIMDSGNWETGERHYVYNPSLFGVEFHLEEKLMEELKSTIREIKLNSLHV